MPFKYSCFISYRAAPGKLARGIIDDLFEALSDETALMLDEDVSSVYLDRKRLQGGDFFDEEITESLCQSVCMIAVFTPNYFSKAQLYCAREYLAMERLERQRLKLLPPGRKNHGLIIPVVIRGEDRLPAEIKKRRQYYNFAAFNKKSNQKIARPRSYFEGIQAIVEYMTNRYWELSALGDDPCAACPDFTLPDQEETQKWLEQLVGPAAAKKG